MKTVTQEYLDGIKEGRAIMRANPDIPAQKWLDSVNRTIKDFAASSPVGQMLRGERDFWKNQIRRAT